MLVGVSFEFGGGVVVDELFTFAGLPVLLPGGGNIRSGLLFELPVRPRRAAIAGHAVQLEKVKLIMSIDK